LHTLIFILIVALALALTFTFTIQLPLLLFFVRPLSFLIRIGKEVINLVLSLLA
jgi:hypothetical protein